MNAVTPDLLSAIIEISEKASDEILKFYNIDYDVEVKDDLTPVTSADVAAHKLITKALKKLTPDIPILSEEDSEISFDERKTWKSYWLVDPLDGTREFIKKNGEFSVTPHREMAPLKKQRQKQKSFLLEKRNAILLLLPEVALTEIHLLIIF